MLPQKGHLKEKVRNDSEKKYVLQRYAVFQNNEYVLRWYPEILRKGYILRKYPATY